MRWSYLICIVLPVYGAAGADSWPQFRGPGGSGRAESAHPLPAEIGPERNVIWKVPLPPGHSSPVVHGDRIYVTAVRDAKLLTIALERESGKVVWEAESPYQQLEPIHTIGSHAQCTPATDGQRIICFFGSVGLLCYDRDGKLLWKRPAGPFKNDMGAASSPILAGEWVILCQDHDMDSFLESIDKRTGRTRWRVDRSEFPRNFGTPVIWDTPAGRQIVVVATLRVVGYDFDTGKELWTVRGLARTCCATPVVGTDGNLYAAGWSAGGDATDRIEIDPFDEAVRKLDSNHNGTLEEAELPAGPVKQRFSQFDRDKDGSITRQEYDYFLGLLQKTRNMLVAIRPGGTGEITDTHVVWQHTRYVPFCASPLYDNGRVFAVKDGGIVACFDARTGETLKVQRVPGTGSYYSSPVAGDGKVFLVNQKGRATVISSAGDWQVLATADFADDVYATPAIVEGRILLRTVGHLYCLGFAKGQ